MQSTVPLTPDKHLGREEGFMHYVAREGRVFLRWTIVACIAAIVLCMVSPGFYFVAVVPAIVLLLSYILLVLTNEIERHSDVEAHDVLERAESATVDDVVDDHTEDHHVHPLSVQIIKRESKTVIAIVAAVMLTAVLIAAILFDFQVVAIGAFVVFAYMMLVAAPLWLGWIEDDIEIEQHRGLHEPEPPDVQTGH